jgi:hypothetical protein
MDTRVKTGTKEGQICHRDTETQRCRDGETKKESEMRGS